MKVKYFKDTDTLYIEFREAAVSETRDLDENTMIDLDQKGQIYAITVEHAGERADIPHFSFEQIPSPVLTRT
ncbi:MAG: DUF2283 domain-containing protein [Leptospirillum sp.]